MQSALRSPDRAPSRAALLDFDGTLGATLPAWTDAFDNALRDHGITLPPDQVIHSCFHACTDDVIRAHGIPQAENFKQRVWEHFIERMNHVSPFPLMEETLAALSERGFKIGVVTNSPRAAVMPVLLRWKIKHLVDTVVTIEDVSHGKPDPQMIHHALNALNVSPSEAFIMGDSLSDVVAGKRAGINTTIAFSPEENGKYLAPNAFQLSQPSHLIHSYGDLWEILGLHQALR